MKFLIWCLLLTGLAFAQPSDDEFWVQRILSSASVVSARLDHAGRHTALCIRKGRGSAPPLYSTFPYGIQFVVPEDAPKTARVRAARAQAAGTITSAWLRYTGEVNAACIEANQDLKFPKVDGRDTYLKILGE
jgi:hypothetical protein